MFKTAITVLALALSLTAASLALTDGPPPDDPDCGNVCEPPGK